MSYKLVHGTKLVSLDEMYFAPEGVPDEVELDQYEDRPKRGWRKVVGWVFLY